VSGESRRQAYCMKSICFESYGVKVQLESSSQVILQTAFQTAQRALLGQTAEIDRCIPDGIFRFELDGDGDCTLIQNEEVMTTASPDRKFWRFFDGLVRILVADFTKPFVFIHAGAIGWRGKAFLFPANSFNGKTTLVYEMLKLGAVYYSDEYAVLDADGLVHPFARPLSVRTRIGEIREIDVDPNSLSAEIGKIPIPVGVVLFTKFEESAVWSPNYLSPGVGAVRLIEFAISVKRNTEFVLSVLNRAVSNAYILESPRSEAKDFAAFFLEFIDNSTFLTKMMLNK